MDLKRINLILIFFQPFFNLKKRFLARLQCSEGRRGGVVRICILWLSLSDDARAQVRPIDHETGSHGVPGIYFKYDMSALKVIVNQAS